MRTLPTSRSRPTVSPFLAYLLVASIAPAHLAAQQDGGARTYGSGLDRPPTVLHQSRLDRPVLRYGSYVGGPGIDRVGSISVITAHEIERLSSTAPDVQELLALGVTTQTAPPGFTIRGMTDGAVGVGSTVTGLPVLTEIVGSEGPDEAVATAYAEGRLFGLFNVQARVQDLEVSGAYRSDPLGGADCFVVGWDILTGLRVGATYFGTGQDDYCLDLDYDGENVWVVGTTFGFLDQTDPVQEPNYGAGDGFLAGLSSDLGTLRYTIQFGGQGLDEGLEVSCTFAGNWPEDRWGPRPWKLAVAGITTAAGFPTTPDAFIGDHVALEDTYAMVFDYEREDLSLGVTLRYSSVLGGSGVDIVHDLVWHPDGGLAGIWETTSPEINTTGRGYSGGVDGILSYLAGPGQVEKRYIGLSAEVNRPLALSIDPLGNYAIGGYMRYPDAGTAWQQYRTSGRRIISNALSGFDGVDSDYGAVWTNTMFTVAGGTTYGEVRVTDDALQPSFTDAPDGFFQEFRKPYSYLQFVNLGDEPVSFRLGDVYDYTVGAGLSTGPEYLPWSDFSGEWAGSGTTGSYDLGLSQQPSYTYVVSADAAAAPLVSYAFDIEQLFDQRVPDDAGPVLAFLNLTDQPIRLEKTDRTAAHNVLDVIAERLGSGNVAGLRLRDDELLDVTTDLDVAPERFTFGLGISFGAMAKRNAVMAYGQLLPYLAVLHASGQASKARQGLQLALFDGFGNPVDVFEVTATDGALPPRSALHLEPYPNPFSTETRLRFTLAHSAPVSFEVFDLFGRSVSARSVGVLSPGRHELVWQARDRSGARMAGGAYLVRLRAGAATESTTVIVSR